MVVRSYRARIGSHLHDKDAERIGGFLTERFGDAPVTPDAFVQAARPKRSPIHDYIEWDDESAAKEYRRHQARATLAAIMVIERVDDEERETRAYHNVAVSESGDRAYVPHHIVWQAPDLREQVIARALRELTYWQARYADYTEFASVHAAIRKTAEAIAA